MEIDIHYIKAIFIEDAAEQIPGISQFFLCRAIVTEFYRDNADVFVTTR